MDREEEIIMEISKIVRDYYNEGVETEWKRIAGRPEFLLTCRFIDRYIKSGDRVLDIGGGPGRYSLYLAGKGCEVTLFDLSDENIKFVKGKAIEDNVSIKTICGDARVADILLQERYDHVLLMGPMYHLLKESDRIDAVNAALKLLKPNGVIFISFINMIAGMIYAMKCQPDIIGDPCEKYFDAFMENTSFAGGAFTQSYFSKQDEILPFMEQFPLDKLHFFGQESISSPCENNIMSQEKEIVDSWIDLCEKICEREDLLSWSEHLMYIGRKRNEEFISKYSMAL
jgi:2-polyprenyl-3-methyl-5-hydroxy-6-metoxy-1,4-benzoquinol methylase